MSDKQKFVSDDPIVQWVVTRYNESKNYYRSLWDKFQDWDEQYFSIPASQKYTWQSNVFVPASFKAVKTLLSRIIAALFPGMAVPFDAVGVEEKDKAGEGPKKRLIGYQFEKTKIFEKFNLYVLQALIRGTSIGKVYWDKQVTYIPRNVEYDEEELVTVDEQGKPLSKKKQYKRIVRKQKKVYDEKILYEGPNFEVIDIYGGIFPDPYATNMKDGYIIHRTVRTEDYLKRNKDKFDNIDKALKTEYPGDEHWAHSRLENLGMSEPETMVHTEGETGGVEGKTDTALSKYEILECHCKFDLNGDGLLEDTILTICNRSVVIKKRLNPYEDGCFVRIGFMPVLNEFFWQGVCELVEPLQQELNDKRNQRLDNVNLVLQKVLVYVENSVDARLLKNFVFAPGARLAVKDINAIKWESPDDVTASSYTEEKLLADDIQETSGAVSVLQPSANSSDIHRTASGLFMLKGEAESSLKTIVMMMESMGLAEIAKKYDSMDKSFMTRPQVVRILGESGYEYPFVTPDDVRYYNCDFIFKGASAYVNREIRLAQLTKLMDIFSKIPQFAMKLDPDKVVKMVANTLGFDEKELMREEMHPLLQQLQMSPALNEMGMGGQGPDTGMGPGADFALQRMVNEGLPLENIEQQMTGLQQQGGMGI